MSRALQELCPSVAKRYGIIESFASNLSRATMNRLNNTKRRTIKYYSNLSSSKGRILRADIVP
jgi:hypothetical protein